MSELKDLTSWAVAFKEKVGRKPTPLDFKGYFGVKISERDYELLWPGEKGSWLERLVLDLLKSTLPDVEVLERKRPLRRPDGSQLELDLWLPELSLAFEVQDFASHSRIEGEVSAWKTVKRGPAYHEEKKRLAKDQLSVRLIDLWEDEILDGRGEMILREAIEAARSTL